jgi:hypothetical protein
MARQARAVGLSSGLFCVCARDRYRQAETRALRSRERPLRRVEPGPATGGARPYRQEMPRGGGKYVGRQGDSRQTGIGGKIGKCFDKYGKDRYAILDFPILETGMATLEETPSRIEPCLLDETSPAILDLVASLSGETHALGARLHPKSAAGLAELVRVMNCYYSNLIEGHNTALRDIERALANQFDTVEERRNLQLEARAHI